MLGAVGDGPLQLDYVHAGGVVGCDNGLWERSRSLEEAIKIGYAHAAA